MMIIFTLILSDKCGYRESVLSKIPFLQNFHLSFQVRYYEIPCRFDPWLLYIVDLLSTLALLPKKNFYDAASSLSLETAPSLLG